MGNGATLPQQPTLRGRFGRLLDAIVSDPGLESRWLNTLSLMEFMGAHKIGASVLRVHGNQQQLEHWADETRHAALLRREAARLGCGPTQYLAATRARSYFQALDRRAGAWAAAACGSADGERSYLLVTSLVERRAMFVYPLYRKRTRSPSVAAAVDSIMGDETTHRIEIGRLTLARFGECGVSSLREAYQIESELFARFVDGLESAADTWLGHE